MVPRATLGKSIEMKKSDRIPNFRLARVQPPESMMRLPGQFEDLNLMMKNKRKNKLKALTKLLISNGFILVLLLQQLLLLFTTTHHLAHAKSLHDVGARNIIRIRSADYDDSGSLVDGYSSAPLSDEDGSTNQDSDIQNNKREFPAYPLITVTLVPPLVQIQIPENSSAIYRNIPITKLHADITLNPPSSTMQDSSNQTRSQLYKSIKQLSNDHNITNQFRINYNLTSHQNLFAIDGPSGDIFLRSKPGDQTYILDVRVSVAPLPDLNALSPDTSELRFETRAPVSIEVIDSNDGEPEPVESILSCMAYDNIDVTTPICTPAFKDSDRGINAKLRYTLDPNDDSLNDTFNLRIDPETGSIYRRFANRQLDQPMIQGIVSVKDGGHPYLETSIRAEITILNSTKTIKRSFNEKPFIPEHNLKNKMSLNGTEEPGTPIANLTPLDDDQDTAVMHIVDGDQNSVFAINAGSLIVAKYIDYSEKKTINLTLMVTDGASKAYYNITIMVPKIVKSMPNGFFTRSVFISNAKIARRGSKLYDAAKYAFDRSFAKYEVYSASSDEARDTFAIDENTGFVSLDKDINFKFNGQHFLMISIEDTRLSPESFRIFVHMTVNVTLLSPPPPPPPTTTTTTTTTTTSTTTSTTTTTTTPRPTTTSTTTTTTTTTTTPRPTTSTTAPTKPQSTTPSTTTTTTTTTSRPIVIISSPPSTTTTVKPSIYHFSTQAPYPPFVDSNQPTQHISPNQYPPNIYDPYYPPGVSNNPWGPPNVIARPQDPNYPQLIPPLPPPPPPPPPVQPPTLTPPTNPTFISDSQVSVKTLARAVIGLMVLLFFLTCTCLVCRCCCRGSSKRKRYRDGNGALLNRSSFHSQQRLHGGHASPHANGSMSRNMNSRLSLRTAGATPASARGMHSKYGAGDSVSLSAMNERSAKHKALIPPPSPMGNQSSILSHEGDDGLYANAFGPGHPQYLNELRRLKPDYTRMSARLPSSKKPASSSNVNSLRPSDGKVHSKSNSVLPSTPVRTSSQSASQIKSKVVANQRPLPNKSNRSADLNSSRTTNTSANVSPSLNDNNSRTILLGSDDIRSPLHHPRQSSRQKQKFHRQVNTDSTADYDDVASHSTADDTTPQTSSENASMSELPFEARFKTFVKQKKNKESTNPANATTTRQQDLVERYDRSLPPAPTGSEDTDNEPTTNLLCDYYADALPVRNGSNHRDSQQYIASNGGGNGSGAVDKGSSRAIANASLNGSKTVLQNGTSEMNNNNLGDQVQINTDDEQEGEEGAEVDDLNDNDDDQDGDNETERGERQLRRKRQAANESDDESDDSADDEEDDEDVEEGVYDLGAPN